MASVLLPTRTWTPSCEQLADQLDGTDQLVVLCDDPDDPVVSRNIEASTAAGVDVVSVGDPDGCSGKAHALAVGLEHAEQDLLVLTDDDVERGDDWFETLVSLARDHGAASATPVFVGGGWWRLIEPAMTAFGSALLCRYGGVWGGGVAFERERLDEQRYRHDLERTVSDDALLWRCLDGTHTTPEFVNTVRVPGDLASVRHRLTRFALTYRYWLPRAFGLLLVLLIAFLVIVAVAPIVATVGATLGARLAYRYLGVDRVTWLLVFPSLVVLPVALAFIALHPVFKWGGRCYQWTGRLDVDVSD